MRTAYRIVLLHTAAWLVYLLILVLGANFLNRDFMINTISSMIPVVLLFYVNSYLLLPRYLPGKRYAPLILWLVVVDFCMILLRLLLMSLLQHGEVSGIVDSLQSPVMFWNQFRVNLLFTGISFAWWYAQRNYKMEHDRQQLEKEILNARLLALRNQINPHFLHNTLSFLYTRTLPYSEQLAGAIAHLSDMMRYSLEEGGADGKVWLKREVEHLQHFIAIYQLRFNDQLQVRLTTHGDHTGLRIMPLLLITFVENAFKHGSLEDVQHPVIIELTTENNQLFFLLKNRKITGRKDPSSGIGLQNIRNRLVLAYPDHRLTIIDDPEDFTVTLALTLNS